MDETPTRRILPLRCQCGALQAKIQPISPMIANRNVCHCKGCRDYAQYLQQTDVILDQYGGTDVFQVSPATWTWLEGKEHLACLQQTEKGALRWYASCCQTPIAHTLPNGKIPFMAINHVAVHREGLTAPLDAYVGPIKARVNTGDLIPQRERKSHKATAWDLLKMLAHLLPLFLGWTIRGERKASPFFDPKTAKPILPPQRLHQPKAAQHTKRVGCG